MKVLFLTSSAPADDGVIADRLALASTELEITNLDSPAAALEEIRRGGDWMALMISPRVPQADALELIEVLRREAAPIAIVPLVTSVQQGFIASALAAGADDVLMVQSQTIVNLPRTLARIQQSPHLRPTGDRRRLRTLYAGDDQLVWTLLGQVSFVGAERATPSSDGVTPLRTPESDGELRFDVVVIDERTGGATPLQVLNSVRAQAPDLPVVMLTSPSGGDFETEALDLGANATLVKTGMFRRRLVATLRNVHQRLELVEQHETLRSREARLRQIVETLPAGVVIISGDGTVLAINASAQALVGAPRRSTVVGQLFTSIVAAEHRDDVTRTLHDVTDGTPSGVPFDVLGTDGVRRSVELQGVLLERDARGSRGVIAVLQSRAEAVADVADRTARHDELIATVATERAHWEGERQSLIERIQALETAATHARHEATRGVANDDERARLETALLAVQAQLETERAARAGVERSLDDARAAAGRDIHTIKAEHLAALRSVEEHRSQVERLRTALEAVEAERASLVEELARADASDRPVPDRSEAVAAVTPDFQLEAVGRFASAITPDVESLVTSIHGAGTLLANQAGITDAAREQAGIITAQAKRAGKLLRQFQKFSEKLSRPAMPVDVSDVVHRVRPLLEQLVGSHIDFEISLGASDAVLASDDDLGQLVSGVVVAVRDLLPIGGVLSLETNASHVSGVDPSTATLTLSAIASGYGVQSPESTAALEALAQRCGGSLEVVDDDGRAGLRVLMPCVVPAISRAESTAA